MMPIGTAVHERTLSLCESLNYREWSGYYAVSAYEAHHEHEYNAIRNAAALIDVCPLFKYRVTGRDAARFVDRIITRDVSRMSIGQVFYTPWCDEQGKVIDDGTVSRLGEQAFRWTAADPSLRWFTQNSAGLDVTIEDISEQVAALALQGPTSARLLGAVADADIERLKYFRATSGTIEGVQVDISRTGYTGDLGYELWMDSGNAVRVFDALMRGGRPFGIKPAGMLALDVARVEAGLLLIDVDFFSSRKALIPSQTYTPPELGLGRLVSLDKARFIGQQALAAERVGSHLLLAGDQDHDRKDEQHGDGAGIDDHLDGGQELRVQGQEEPGHAGQVDDEEQGPVDGVALEDQPGCRADHQRRQDREGDERHDGTRSGGMGTGDDGVPSARAGSSASSISLV